MKPTVKPMPHQIKGILLLEKVGGNTLLADDMGLGKTLQTLGYLYRNPDAFPAVIVCPAAVKFNWEHESLLFFGMRASVCEGMTPPIFNRNSFATHPPITIVNYDILGKWEEYLCQVGFKTLILDECQMISNTASKRTKVTRRMSQHAERVLALSGTPLSMRVVDLWSVLNMIWPDEFPSIFAFSERYSYKKMTPWGVEYFGSKNLKELNTKLLELGMIRRKKDILKLPPKTYKITLIKMDNPSEYKFAEKDFLGWIQRTSPHKLRSVRKVEKMAKVGYLLRLCAKKKLKAIVSKVNKFLTDNPNKKLVLMGIHQKALRVLEKRIHFPHVTIDGHVAGRKRQTAIDQFQHDPKIRLAICNMLAAGVGITLTAAHHLWFFEMWHNPAAHNQAADRVCRIGQHHPVTIEYLIAEGTLEEKLCRILQERQKVVSATMDGVECTDDNAEFNIYDELLDALGDL